MSARETLQNIYYFLATVIPNAYNTGNWDEKTLGHAFHWAKYCEKIYNYAANKPCAGALDHHIRSMGASLENEYSPDICLNYLKSSSKVLCKALLANQNLEGTIYQYVLRKANEEGILKEVLENAIEMKSILVILVESLSPSSSSSSLDTLSKKIDCCLLLEHVQEAIVNSASKEEAKEWLKEFLKEFFSSAEKMEKILLLILTCSMNKSDDLQKIQQTFLNQLLQRVTKSEEFYEPTTASYLWKQSPSILCSLSCISFAFYKCYISILVELVNLMEANYKGTDIKWEMSCPPVGLEFSFPDILSCFKALLHSQTKVSRSTHVLIVALANNPKESPVWNEILGIIAEFE